MADYNFKTWESMSIEIGWGGSEAYYYIILDHELDTSQYADPSEDVNRLYSGVCPPMAYGNVYHLENILSQMVKIPKYEGRNWTYFVGDLQRRTFYVYWCDVFSDWEYWEVVTVQVEYDWAYGKTLPSVDVLSNPIQDIIDNRQMFLFTVHQTAPGATDRVYVYLNGVELSFIGYINDRNPIGTFNLDMTAQYVPDDTGILSIKSYNFKLERTCYDYCLYYANEYGGWDWLLVGGRVLQKDKFSRLSYKKNIDPQEVMYCTKVNYATTINENWELSTSWLSDTQSDKIQSLFASNQVYLHDLNSGEIIPVGITNTSVEHKNYINQGRKMYAYNIEVESLNPKYRY